jgi:hypothetical protein
MKAKLILALLLLAGLAAAPPKARADSSEDTLIKIMDAAHVADNSIPAGTDIKNLLDSVTSCLSDPLKDRYSCAAAIPDGDQNPYIGTILDAIDLYVAIDAGDFWGSVDVVWRWVSERAVCIVADYFTGGAVTASGLCGIIGDLVGLAVDIAEAVYAVLKDIFGFFADVAEAIYCFFFSCDSGPPPELIAWESFFQPVLSCNSADPKDNCWRSWVETTNSVGDIFEQKVQAQIQAAHTVIWDPNCVCPQNTKAYSSLQYGLPVCSNPGGCACASDPNNTTCCQTYGQYCNVGDDCLQTDAATFRTEAQQLWAADILTPDNGVMVNLARARTTYLNDGNIITRAATYAAQSQDPWLTSSAAADFCSKDASYGFPAQTGFNYEHVDRWITKQHSAHQNDSQNDLATQAHALTTRAWCSSAFWENGVKPKVVETVLQQIKDHGCPNLQCDSADHYANCKSMMQRINWTGLNCGVDLDKVLAGLHCPSWQCDSPDSYAQCTSTMPKIGQIPTSCSVDLNKYLAVLNGKCQGLTCDTAEDYRDCEGAMGVLHKLNLVPNQQCRLDVAVAGKHAAERIRDYIKGQGSQFTCVVNPTGGAHSAGVLAPAGQLNRSVSPQTAQIPNLAGGQPSGAALAKPGQRSGEKPVMITAGPKTKGETPTLQTNPASPNISGVSANPSALSTAAAVLQCPRPKHLNVCNQKYQEWYGFLDVPLPIVTCTVDQASMQIVAQMQAAMQKVQDQLHFLLTIDSIDPLVAWDNGDVYYVLQKNPNLNQGFFTVPPNSQPGFVLATAVNETIDGVPAPTVCFNQAAAQAAAAHANDEKAHTGVSLEDQAQRLAGKLRSGDYSHPEVVGSERQGVTHTSAVRPLLQGTEQTKTTTAVTTQTSTAGAAQTNAGKAGATAAVQQYEPILQGSAAAKAPTGAQTAAAPALTTQRQKTAKEWGAAAPAPATAPQNAPVVGTTANPQGTQLKSNVRPLAGTTIAKTTAPGVQAPESKPMSGTVPPSTSPGTTPAAPAPIAKPPALAVKPGQTLFPELSSTEELRVGGKPVAWGGVLQVDAALAAAINKNNSGLCEFLIEHTVRNSGTAKAGGFRTAWTNDAVKGDWNRQWNPLDPGSSKTEKDLVLLKPGANVLQLVVDDLQQVQEANKANNSRRVRIDVTGNCGVASRVAPAQHPIIPKPPGQ